MQCIASPVQVRGAGAGVLRRVPGQRDGAERERRLPRLYRQDPRGPARELPPGKYYIILYYLYFLNIFLNRRSPG